MNYIEAVKAYKDGFMVTREPWPRSDKDSDEEGVYIWLLNWHEGLKSIQYVKRDGRFVRNVLTAHDPIFPGEVLADDWIKWDLGEWKERDDELL
jgi:hypothetical protein